MMSDTAGDEQIPRGKIALRFILGFAVCIFAVGSGLVAAHGPAHLLVNPGSVVAFLTGSAIGLCSIALLITGGLRLANGTPLARTWWPSLALTAVLAALALYLIEVTAR
jgi:hypothetical protein